MNAAALQCKDIADGAFIGAVRAVDRGIGASVADLSRATGWPEKLVIAKARKLIRRGAITGCPCGCRGDFAAPPVVHWPFLGPVPVCPAGDKLETALEPVADAADFDAVTCPACRADIIFQVASGARS